jgi:hypothetical protein
MINKQNDLINIYLKTIKVIFVNYSINMIFYV